MVDGNRKNEMHDLGHEDTVINGTYRESSHAARYEPLDVISAQIPDAGRTYEQLTTVINVDVAEQSLSDRETFENFECKLNTGVSSSAEYKSLQQRELSQSVEYETIKFKEEHNSHEKVYEN